jgi:hypothetical protein
VSVRTIAACALAATLFLGARVTEASCSAPTRLIAEVGVNVSKAQYRVSAPGLARLVDQSGNECFNWVVDGEIKIMQHKPRVDYTVAGSGPGHWIYTLDAPAQPASCYTASITSSGGYVLTPLTGSGFAGPACWNGEDELPQPDPEPRNCTPIWDVEGQTWLDPECDTPVLLNLGTGSYELTSAADGVRFDIRNEGSARQVAWTSRGSELAFLAYDRNANGSIDSGAELFGSATMLATGIRAKHGFEALAELDANGDGLLSPQDPAWTSLVLWTDRNHDGRSASSELQRVGESRVAWLSAAYDQKINRRDQWGNLYRYMSHAAIRVNAENTRRIPYYDVFLTTE